MLGAAAEDTGEYLFGVETMKAMKKELTKVNVKVKKDFSRVSRSHFCTRIQGDTATPIQGDKLT